MNAECGTANLTSGVVTRGILSQLLESGLVFISLPNKVVGLRPIILKAIQ